MAPILHLPLEITGYIVQHLSLNDLLCLRQTCRTLNNNTFHMFSEDCFRMRRVMLDRRSLEALASIAKHPTLGPAVKEVEISTNHLLPFDELYTTEPPSKTLLELVDGIEREESGSDEETEEEDEGGEEETTSDEEASRSSSHHFPHLRGLDEEAYHKAFEDQQELIRRGDDIKHFTHALKGLTNCVIFRVTDDNRVWGLRRLRREIGILPQRCVTFASPESIKLVRRLLYAFFTALAESDASIEFLEIASGCIVDNANRISADMLVKPSSTILNNFRLNTLTTLHLSLDSKSPEHNATSVNWAYDLIRFIERFPELSEFGIDFENRDGDGLSASGSPILRPFSYGSVNYATYTRFPKLSQLLYIPKLKTVRLGMIDCAAMDITFFLLRHQKTLTNIYLKGITLVNDNREVGGWHWLVKVVRDVFRTVSFEMENCSVPDSGGLLRLEDKHHYHDETRQVLKAADTKGLDNIIKLLRRRA